MNTCGCAERWLQPGTEYADPAMLKLSKAWYQGLGISDGPAANGAGECSLTKHCCVSEMHSAVRPACSEPVRPNLKH